MIVVLTRMFICVFISVCISIRNINSFIWVHACFHLLSKASWRWRCREYLSNIPLKTTADSLHLTREQKLSVRIQLLAQFWFSRKSHLETRFCYQLFENAVTWHPNHLWRWDSCVGMTYWKVDLSKPQMNNCGYLKLLTTSQSLRRSQLPTLEPFLMYLI